MKQNLVFDVRSSLVVFLVALPLCLGIALASGAPLFSGLIAGMIGGIVIGAASNSHLSVSGPAAGLAVIVASAIAELGDFYIFTLAVALSGIIQIALGFFKAGKIGDYFPNSVIKGMLAAIGVILILKQIPHALGYDADWMGDTSFFQLDGHNTFSEILFALKALSPGAIIISSSCLVLMLIWNKLSSKNITAFRIFPSALAAVLLGSGLNILFKDLAPHLHLDSTHLVSLDFSGGVQGLFNKLQLPVWSGFGSASVYKVAFTLAIVGSLETLLSVNAADKLDTQKRTTDTNRELMAQGTGNLLSGLIGGLPITAVIVRTSANMAGGARSKASAILHGFWLLLCVTFIPQYIELIPLSALAAILLLVGFKLTTPSLYKEIYAKGKDQFLPFIITIAAIIFTDLLIGIMIGMVVGVFFVIRSNLQHCIQVEKNEGKVEIEFIKDVTFFHKSVLSDALKAISEGASVSFKSSEFIAVDNDISLLLEDFYLQAKDRKIKVLNKV